VTVTALERRRTSADLALGAVVLLLGLGVLAHAGLATAVSVVLLGWLLLVAGAAGLVSSLMRRHEGGYWSAALGGGLLAVLGLVVLRNQAAAAVTLTLLAGSMFLVVGIVRLVAAVDEPQHRAALLLAGAVSTVLGLLVVFNLFTASLTLLGVLIAVQIIVDGISLMAIGRLRPVRTATQDPAAGTP
jgi:uncharacterized membrane protein HdeD (DUF308 family)